MATKAPKHRNTALPEFSKAMHGFRSASTVQPYDSRPKRQRSRAAAKSAAIRGGW